MLLPLLSSGRRAGAMYRSLCHTAVRRALQPPLAALSARTVHRKGPPDLSEEKEDQGPIKFSTSKGSHRQWTVARSLGSDYQRPWWKVLPLSLFLTGALIWAFFREETEIDEILYRPVSELLGESEASEGSDKNK